MGAPSDGERFAGDDPVHKPEARLRDIVVSVHRAFRLDRFGSPREVTLVAQPAPDHRGPGIVTTVWRLETGANRYAVTRLTGLDPCAAHSFDRLRTVLAASGLPVAPPLRTPAGRTVIEFDGGLYGVAPWIDGELVPACEWHETHARRVGELLARHHVTLAEACPDAAAPLRPDIPDGASAKAAIDRYGERACHDAARCGPPLSDEARALVRARHDRLESEAHLRPADGLMFTATGHTHGPLREHHVRFGRASQTSMTASQTSMIDDDGTRVLAFHGWHAIAPRAHAEDVARTVASLFGRILDDRAGVFDAKLVGAFVAGYRSVAPLDGESLLAAARLVWWRRLCDFSGLDQYADTGDPADLRRWLAESRSLVAWSEQREELEAALVSG